MAALDDSVRMVRMVHGALLASMFLYPFIGEQVAGRREPKDVGMMYFAMLVTAFVAAAAAIVVRQRFVIPAENALRLNDEEAMAAARWKVGQIIMLALFEAVVLYGFVLRLLGASLTQAIPFYAGGIVLALLFAPRRPS